MSKGAALPNDVEALKSLGLERSSALEAAEALLISQKLELERLRFQISCLKRMKYGCSSEQLVQRLTQIQLTLEDLESSLAQTPEAVRPIPKESSRRRPFDRRCRDTCCGKRWSTRYPALVLSVVELYDL